MTPTKEMTAADKSTRRTATFSTAIALAATATVIAGFAPSYYLKSALHITHYPTGRPISASLPVILHVHALVFSAWIVLLVIQIRLSATRCIGLHRKIGYAGAILAAVMLVLGVAVAIRGGRDGWNPGGPFRDSLEFMIVGLADIVVFASYIGIGLLYRRQPAVHKRMMILGTVGGLMCPAITRMPLIAGKPAPMYAVLILLVLAWAARDLLVERRWFPLSLAGGLLVLATFPARVMIGHSAMWHSMTKWLIR